MGWQDKVEGLCLCKHALIDHSHGFYVTCCNQERWRYVCNINNHHHTCIIKDCKCARFELDNLAVVREVDMWGAH